jgi:hypothetical protein
MCWNWRARRGAAGALAVLLGAAGSLAGSEDSLPVDCFPDGVARWEAAGPDPSSRYGAANLPGIVLGPPGDSPPTAGSTSVASLGNGGRAVLEFRQTVIEDGPGPDFIVFENAFFVGSVPASPGDDYQIFAEPGTVEASADGEQWFLFPFDAQALAEAAGVNIDKDLHLRLRGLAGITPTFTGNWTVPDDPEVWDQGGQGGVSGAGGDAFDLATVGLSHARFVRLTDAASGNGPTGSAEGFDLDGIVVLNARPATPSAPDRDGDGLSDLAEERLYGSGPDLPDSDGDGVDDGREVARCHDPNAAGEAPWFVREPRLLLRGSGCTEARWTFLGTSARYDLIRGDLDGVVETPEGVELGPASCLVDQTAAVRWSCDVSVPGPGVAFYYLVREAGEVHYGWSSSLAPRAAAGGCP